MGMFDNLVCKYPLPVEGTNGLLYQTKDTPSQMISNYEIREDGTLWEEDYDIVDNSDPTAEGIARIFGMMTRVNERWVPVTGFIGEIRFYNYTHEKTIEFSAYFVDSKLKELHLIKEV